MFSSAAKHCCYRCTVIDESFCIQEKLGDAVLGTTTPQATYTSSMIGGGQLGHMAHIWHLGFILKHPVAMHQHLSALSVQCNQSAKINLLV